MSVSFYKLIHIIGIVMLFLSLGATLMHVVAGGARDHSWRRHLAISHGLGLLLIFISGFGMLAKLQIFWPWPGWVIPRDVYLDYFRRFNNPDCP